MRDMAIRKPRCKKKGGNSATNPAARQLFQPRKIEPSNESNITSLVHALYGSVPGACGFQYVDISSEINFSPSDDVNVEFHVERETLVPVPHSILDIAKGLADENELIKALRKFTNSEVEALERATQGQNSNETWKLQRTGRITASVSHHVMTKVQSVNCASKNLPTCSSLLRSICRPSSSGKSIAACRYGKQMENEAREKYAKVAKETHKKVKVRTCGLFVLANAAYIGASQDGMVACNCCGKGLLQNQMPIQNCP